MNLLRAWAILIPILSILIYVSIKYPCLIINNNFLNQVINVEIINILAVTTTVTLGVASLLYFKIIDLLAIANRKRIYIKGTEKNIKFDKMILAFDRAKSAIKVSSMLLIGLFGMVFVLLFVKSWVPVNHVIVHALIGSFCLSVFLGNVLSMIEIHLAIFRLPSVRT